MSDVHTPKVNVLLSTYNGEMYVREQLDSILQQKDVDVVLHVRDDGSKDSTVAILTEYAAKHTNIHVFQKENVGVVKSFFELMRIADTTSEYFAFCDQDDVWEPAKLANAVEHLSKANNDIPQLYFCRLEYVDQHLNHLGYSPDACKVGFGNALVQNLATGCAVVINNTAREMILSHLPSQAMMHDWWSYLVVSAFGNVIFDNRVGIKYRQHGSNEVGGTPSLMESMKRRFKRFKNHGKHVFLVSEQASEFVRCHGATLPFNIKKTADRFLASKSTLGSRVRYTLNMDVWRNTTLDDFILRVMILIDRY